MSTKIDGTQQGNTLLESALAENGLKSYFQALYNTSGGMRIEFTVMGALKLKPYELFQFSALDSTPKAYKNRQFRITSISYDFVNNTSKVTGYQVGSRFVSANNTPKDPPLKRRQRAIETELYAVEDERFLEVLEDISGVDGETLKKANNLSDVDSVSDARDNLSVYSRAELDATQLQNEVDLVQLGLQDDALFLQKADKGIQVTLTPSGGLTGGGINDLSADSEFGVSIADSGVTTVKINNLAVTTAKVADLNITTGKLANNAVTTVKILDANVTNAKLANSTISGKALGTNLDSLSAGNGLTGTAYNGSAPQTWAIDPTAPIKITGDKVDLGFVAPLILTGNDLDVQDAGVAQRGVVSIGAQTFKGNKTFDDDILLDGKFQNKGSFTSGFSGSGFRLQKDSSVWGMELDDVFIRGALFASEFIINQISALNGSDFLSPAVGKVEVVAGTPPAEVLTMSDPQGNDVTGFKANDIVIVQQVTPQAYDGAAGQIVKRIVREVDSVTDNVVTLKTLTGAPTASGTIEVGDIMVALGNTTDTARQAHIYRSVIDSGAPFVRINENVNSWASFGDAEKLMLQYGKLSGLTIDSTTLTGNGLYTANAFLTGSLVVGDLGKTDNYLEYDSGVLNIDGTVVIRGGSGIGNLTDAGALALLDSVTGANIDDATIEVAKLGTTVISGGLIITSLLSADNVQTGTLTSQTNNTTFNLDTGQFDADVFKLSTPAIVVNSTTPKIALGASADSITVGGTEKGFIATGGGDFKVYGDSNNYIRKEGDSLDIKADDITLTAVGDLAEAVLQINTDLVQLGLEAGGAYSGIQFLAGQTIISASEDGRLAEIRLDATNPESIINLVADRFDFTSSDIIIRGAIDGAGAYDPDAVAKIALGENADTITVGNTTAGFIADGAGNFKAYSNTTNYIRKLSSSIDIKSDTFGLATGTIILQSGGSGKIALGATATAISTSGDEVGFIANGSGDFKAYGDANNYIRKVGASLDIKAENFNLASTGLSIRSGVNPLIEVSSTGKITNSDSDFLISKDGFKVEAFDGTTFKASRSYSVDLSPSRMYIGGFDAGSFKTGATGIIKVERTGTEAVPNLMIDVEGNLFIIGLPTADQEQTGAIWVDGSGFLKMSSETPTVPATPTGLAMCKSRLNEQMRISWNPVGDATSYTLQRSTDGISWSVLATPTATQFLDSLPFTNKATTYHYRVRANNGAGSSAYSAGINNTWNGATNCETLNPESVTIIMNGEFSRVDWITPNAGNPSTYSIDYSINGGSLLSLTTGITGSATSWDFDACGLGSNGDSLVMRVTAHFATPTETANSSSDPESISGCF